MRAWTKCAWAWVLASAAICSAADVSVQLPLRRTAYQTNENIDIAVLRISAEPLAAGDLTLTLSGEDGSRAVCTFPVGAAPVVETVLPPAKAKPRPGEPAAPTSLHDARRTEHLRLDGRLLRPGTYTITAAVDGATATSHIDVHSHIRKSTFRLISWNGRGNGADQVYCGEEGTGLNLMYAGQSGHDQDANIRGGIDYMRNDTMGGAHQMDGRQECDWSDPYVMAGGMARVARQALVDRTSGNVIGVHFYDEPGLTWQKHPVTGVFSPNNIPSQDWAFKAAFGTDAMQYTAVKPDDVASVAQWEAWLRWKQVFMESAWRLGAFSVNYVDPQMISTTQSMYGWLAFGDGYYFNIARALPVMSGHGGYDDLAGGYLCPGFFFELGWARDYAKPIWYLPQWWDRIPSPVYRLEQYLTFMMGPQGLMMPPSAACEAPGASPTDNALLESNRLMARLGTIFTAMPVTRADVAVLYSMSQNVQAMVSTPDLLGAQDFPGQAERLLLLYTAAKTAHIPLFPVVEEDILDGTVAANHKAIILTGIERLDPRVVKALEAYVKGGGKVILGDECKVPIAGAVRLGAEIHTRIYEEAQKIFKEADPSTRRVLGCTARGPAAYFREAAPIAKALTARCREIGIAPIVECTEPQVFASRHSFGDVEYLFLVNAASDATGTQEGQWNSVRAIEAGVKLVDDGRPLYDAIASGEAREFKKEGGRLTAALRFGAGQLRVFARTARPVAAVQVMTPVLATGDFLTGSPKRLEIQALVVDASGQALNGAMPLSVTVLDPAGAARYDLYRATERGVLRLDLQLGVNEPVGEWRVTVKDLLSGKTGTATFTNRAAAQCGALVGAVPRAVYFPADYDNIFRFFRTHRNLALVIGSSDYDKAQADRLAGNLARWGIQGQVVAAAELKKKVRPDEAKRTWTGGYANPDLDMPGDAAILFGSPDDNVVIKALMPNNLAATVLPYVPAVGVFPGHGRGMLAWQTDAVAYYNYESIACIAYDAAGLAEAVGSLFEIASGYKPATESILPATAAVTPARAVPAPAPAPKVISEIQLRDRAVAMKALTDGGLLVLTQDGTLSRFDQAAKALWQKTIEGGGVGEWAMDASPDGAVTVVGAYQHLVGLDAKGAPLFDFPMRFPSQRRDGTPVSAPTCVAVAADGSHVAAGAANGNVVILTRTGQKVYVGGAMTPDEFQAWSKLRSAWEVGKPDRDAAAKAHKEALAKWQEANAAWEQAPKESRGAKPVKPANLPKAPPAPPLPTKETACALAFSADGSVLLALTENRGRLLRVTDGTEIAAVPGAGMGKGGGAAAPAALADRFLVSNGKDGVVVVSPADGKLLGELALPRVQPPEGTRDIRRGPWYWAGDVVVGLQPAGEGALIASKVDGTVRRVKAIAGKFEDQVVWTTPTPQRLAKLLTVDKDRAALACWGGMLRILNATDGKVLAEHTYDTDIAALTWAGDRLLVGLADGRLLTIERP